MARLRRSRFAQAVLLLAVLCAAGVALYLDERETRQQTHELSVPSAPDWVELDIITQEVNPGTGKVTLYVVPLPHGSLAQDGDPQVFGRQVEITVESASRTVFRTAPGEAGPPQQVQSEIFAGTETDYPFDRVAFFWAEGIIAASLTVAVIAGTRVEHRKRVAAET